MAINNNVYYNAAYKGFIKGALSGRKFTSATATDYLKLTQAAQAFAKQVDAGIAFDALVSTGSSNTMLVDTASNTIQSNTQVRPSLLSDICFAQISGSYTEDSTQADYTVPAAACVACFTEALLLIVSP